MRWLMLVALLAASSADAATVTFSLAREVDAREATIALRRIDSTADLAKAPSIERTVDLSQPLPALDLAPGHWSARVAADGVWHGEQFFTIAGDTAVALDVWASAIVRGTLVAKSKPEKVLVRFEPASADGPAAGETSCVVNDAAFRCTVPRAPLHLRLRVPGHIAHYLFDVQPPLDAGKLTLREGHSIVGRVTLPRELRERVREVTIRADPAGAAGHLTAVTAKAEKNGIFHLDGVAPGDWTIRASHPDALHSLPVTVTMRAGLDASLPSPLALERPRRIRVQVQPALAPDGKPWRIELDRRVSANRLDPFTESRAGVDGTWESGPLVPAEYALTVETTAGDAWHSEDITLGATDATIHVAVETRRVRGSVTLGGKPLAAALTFEAGGREAKTSSRDDGTFEVVLPSAADAWDVHIESEHPTLERALENVRISASNEITVDLPNVIVRGEVVDEEGAPVPFAIVRVLRVQGRHLVDPVANESGTFSIAALPPGPNQLQALGSDYRESDPVPVIIPEAGEAAPVRLVVRRPKLVRGRVISPFGPVANAEVLVRPVGVGPRSVGVKLTDASGAFVAPIPREARELDVFVAPPGFSYTMDRVVWRDSLLVVRTGNDGGALEVRGEGDVLLTHGGATTPLRTVAANLPLMEPGPYTACANGRCVSGVLPPHGTLTLDLSSTR